MMSIEVKLPELGENVETAQVLTVLVGPGDVVAKDQPILELETDKATAEVPSDAAGVVESVRVKAGEDIKVGQTLIVLTETEEKPPAAHQAPAAPPRETPAPAARPGPKPAPPRETPAPAAPPRPEPAPPRETPVHQAPFPASVPVPASPSVRRLARELGIAIGDVPGTGPGGRITETDVKNHARGLLARGGAKTPPAPETAAEGTIAPELPDFSAWGEVSREPASKIRRLTGQAMSLSWSVIPHVTQFDQADITDLEAWRKQHGARVENAGGKLTWTAIIVKTAAAALKVFPRFNASYDDRRAEIVYKKYVNVGVAVDTDRGLLVPVIRDADKKNIVEISRDLADLAERARNRKITSDQLQGANLNISNLGGLGTTNFSPIVAWPQVAVIGIGRAAVQAVHDGESFAPRLILPLAVSYDHRVNDGADAARFLRWIAEALEQPLLIALEG